MRVISGSARGARISCPGSARPTSDKAKEGIFSSIQFLLAGAKCVDMCAGSGALGIEALSRGAAHCVFVEQNRAACEVIKENLRATNLIDRTNIVAAAVKDFMAREGGKYDFLFFDPPYEMELDEQLTSGIAGLLSPAGQLLFESGSKTPPEFDGLQLIKTYKYGNSFVYKYTLCGNV